ncbi:hypothetical protein VTO73DRAFT_7016 [Trametes versicolor]
MDTSTCSSFGTYLHELRDYSAGTKQTRLEIECCSSPKDGGARLTSFEPRSNERPPASGKAKLCRMRSRAVTKSGNSFDAVHTLRRCSHSHLGWTTNAGTQSAFRARVLHRLERACANKPETCIEC